MPEYKIGDRIKTQCGSWSHPIWEYGRIAGWDGDEENPSYRCNWDDGGYDYMLACEIEPA